MIGDDELVTGSSRGFALLALLALAFTGGLAMARQATHSTATPNADLCSAAALPARWGRVATEVATGRFELQIAVQTRWRESLHDMEGLLPDPSERRAARVLRAAETTVSDHPWPAQQLAAFDALSAYLSRECDAVDTWWTER